MVPDSHNFHIPNDSTHINPGVWLRIEIRVTLDKGLYNEYPRTCN